MSKELKAEDYVVKGKRLDGRKIDELRPLKIETGVIESADGSCYLEWGQNKVLAAVYGPKECQPKHQANPYKANIRYYYRMASFSVSDRKNPRPGRREMEISKVCGEALDRAILTERFPNTNIDVSVEILDSNAGTRVAALTAASVAVASAGIPMRDLVTAVSVGKLGSNIITDLTKEEEDAPGAVDLALAMLPQTQEYVLMQMDGIISKKEFTQALGNARNAVKQIYEIQKQALKKNYELEVKE